MWFLNDFWFYVKAIKNIYIQENTPSQIFSKTLLRYLNTVMNPSPWLFPRCLPDISNFLLGFVMIIYVYIVLRWRQHIPEIFLLPDILLSVLHFFNFIRFCHFYSFKLFFYFYILRNLLYILFGESVACSFAVSDWLRAPALLYFVGESSVINQGGTALSDVLWIIYD